MASLFIISAPSGGGKTSLIKALVDQTEHLSVAVSHTTRHARAGEIEGEHYYFVTQTEFDAIKNDHGFIESAQVFDHYYGSAKQTVEDLLAKNQDVILEIDWQGARQVRQIFTQAVSIFILPPSNSALKNRLTDRAQDDASVIERRMSRAQDEMVHFNEYDYLVINDDFELALSDLQTIVQSQRLTLPQQIQRQQNLLAQLIV